MLRPLSNRSGNRLLRDNLLRRQYLACRISVLLGIPWGKIHHGHTQRGQLDSGGCKLRVENERLGKIGSRFFSPTALFEEGAKVVVCYRVAMNVRQVSERGIILTHFDQDRSQIVSVQHARRLERDGSFERCARLGQHTATGVTEAQIVVRRGVVCLLERGLLVQLCRL